MGIIKPKLKKKKVPYKRIGSALVPPAAFSVVPNYTLPKTVGGNTKLVTRFAANSTAIASSVAFEKTQNDEAGSQSFKSALKNSQVVTPTQLSLQNSSNPKLQVDKKRKKQKIDKRPNKINERRNSADVNVHLSPSLEKYISLNSSADLQRISQTLVQNQFKGPGQLSKKEKEKVVSEIQRVLSSRGPQSEKTKNSQDSPSSVNVHITGSLEEFLQDAVENDPKLLEKALFETKDIIRSDLQQNKSFTNNSALVHGKVSSEAVEEITEAVQQTLVNMLQGERQQSVETTFSEESSEEEPIIKVDENKSKELLYYIEALKAANINSSIINEKQKAEEIKEITEAVGKTMVELWEKFLSQANEKKLEEELKRNAYKNEIEEKRENSIPVKMNHAAVETDETLLMKTKMKKVKGRKSRKSKVERSCSEESSSNTRSCSCESSMESSSTEVSSLKQKSKKNIKSNRKHKQKNKRVRKSECLEKEESKVSQILSDISDDPKNEERVFLFRRASSRFFSKFFDRFKDRKSQSNDASGLPEKNKNEKVNQSCQCECPTYVTKAVSALKIQEKVEENEDLTSEELSENQTSDSSFCEERETLIEEIADGFVHLLSDHKHSVTSQASLETRFKENKNKELLKAANLKKKAKSEKVVIHLYTDSEKSFVSQEAVSCKTKSENSKELLKESEVQPEDSDDEELYETMLKLMRKLIDPKMTRTSSLSGDEDLELETNRRFKRNKLRKLKCLVESKSLRSLEEVMDDEINTSGGRRREKRRKNLEQLKSRFMNSDISSLEKEFGDHLSDLDFQDEENDLRVKKRKQMKEERYQATKESLYRALAQLHFFHVHYGDSAGIRKDAESLMQTRKLPDWLTDPNELSPLFKSYDLQLKRKDEKIRKLKIIQRSVAGGDGDDNRLTESCKKELEQVKIEKSNLISKCHQFTLQLDSLQNKVEKEMKEKQDADRIVQQMKEQLEVAHQDLATAVNDQQKSRVELNDLRATIKRLEEEIELRILKSIHEITIKGLKNEIEEVKDRYSVEINNYKAMLKTAQIEQANCQLDSTAISAKLSAVEADIESLNQNRINLLNEIEVLKEKNTLLVEQYEIGQIHLSNTIRVAERALLERSTFAELAEKEGKAAKDALNHSMKEKFEMGRMEESLRQVKLRLANQTLDVNDKLKDCEKSHQTQIIKLEREIQHLKKQLLDKDEIIYELKEIDEQRKIELEAVCKVAANENRILLKDLHSSYPHKDFDDV